MRPTGSSETVAPVAIRRKGHQTRGMGPGDLDGLGPVCDFMGQTSGEAARCRSAYNR